MPEFSAESKDIGSARAGRTHSINAVERRIDAIVAQAPDLTDKQIDRLTRILAPALAVVDLEATRRAVEGQVA